MSRGNKSFQAVVMPQDKYEETHKCGDHEERKVKWTEQIGGAFKLHYELPKWTKQKRRMTVYERRVSELDDCRKMLENVSYDSDISEDLYLRIKTLERSLHIKPRE